MVVGYVAAMPDVHLGKGATIGSVFASRDFVCPNAVGVDIGCGMCAVKVPGLTRLGLSETFLMKLHGQLVERIPTGFNSHEKASSEMRAAMKRLVDEHKPTGHTRGVIAERHVKQIGTLGGGNHFIELLHDEGDDIWLMLHSGSRNIGNITAQYYDGLAARQTGTSKENLAHLAIASDAGQDYLRDMHFCQAYAMENRKFMMNSFV
ncbi:Protein rtcB, putative, partial [Perkinsus marinus ATCC 50983]